MSILIPIAIPPLLLACTLTADEKSAPQPGSPVDIARFASLFAWSAPPIQYTGGDVEEPIALACEDGVWTATVGPGGTSVNFGLQWEEPRQPTTVSVLYADAASSPEMNGQELQAWVHPERILEGGESPWQGPWRALTEVKGFSVERTGLCWNYGLPPIDAGLYKLRIVLTDRTTARLQRIEAFGAARWRSSEFHVAFDPPRDDPRNMVECCNAEARRVSPLAGRDGFTVDAMASDAPMNSNDRAIFTVRAGSRSFSFLLNDLDVCREMVIKPFGAKVTKAEARVESSRETTITERVLALPEQTLDGALQKVPAKKRNKWLALSPPLNPRKFAVQPNGDVFSREECDLVYSFASGEVPDYKRREPQHVEQDHLPVLHAEWEEGGLRWDQGYVVAPLGDRFDDPTRDTVLLTRITARNHSSDARSAVLWLCLRGGNDRPTKIRTEGGVIYEESHARALLSTGDWNTESLGDQLRFTVTVPAGEARSMEVEIPFDAIQKAPPKITFEEARRQTIEYWRTTLARGADFHVPDERVNNLWKSLLIHQYCWGDYDAASGICRPNVAAFSYGPVGNESSQMAKALDMFGHAKLAEDYFVGMWRKQGDGGLPARCTNGRGCMPGWWGNYVFNTGFELWNLCNHYRFTADRAWLDGVLPTLVRACDWIAEQRRTTVSDARPVLASGFFPPCSLEDEGRWFYWTMTNGYLYLGMHSLAQVLAGIGHPEAGRIATEAEAYLNDLRRGIGESTVRCPVVRLRDGAWVPSIPKHLYRRGRMEGHYEAELGALHLLATEVYPPRSPPMDWTLQFLEDVVFMTEAPSHDSIIPYASIERDWFALGGYGKTQPYLVNTQGAYLRRDQPKLFLRSFWNQLVAQNFADINAFPEHICWGGAADCKTYEEAMWLQQFRSMLVLDDDGILRLCVAAPREWTRQGKMISVRNAPTFFGPVSYEVRSDVDRGTMTAQVRFTPRSPPARFSLRLRHPEERRIRSVTLNGAPRTNFDAAREEIELPPQGGTSAIVASY